MRFVLLFKPGKGPKKLDISASLFSRSYKFIRSPKQEVYLFAKRMDENQILDCMESFSLLHANKHLKSFIFTKYFYHFSCCSCKCFSFPYFTFYISLC